MIKYSLIALTFLLPFESYGQHCPYDPIRVIVLDIKYNNKVIDGLQVNLISKNKSNTSDTCSEAENKSFMKLNSKGEYNNDHFTFAKNMYIVFVGNSIELDCWSQIIITDTDGKKNGGEFESMTIDINSLDFYSLCVDFWSIIKSKKIELKRK
ncbi:MAG: hypothetical protein ACOZCO_17340 [Bacteroidota bacterium]